MKIHDGLQNNEEAIRSFLLIGQSNMAGRGFLAEQIPLMVGGLGDFLKHYDDGNTALVNYPKINEALARFAEITPRTVFVCAEGLTSNPDHLHFNHHSLQEFGLRYYEAFRTIEDKEQIFDEKNKSDDGVRTQMEML